MTDDLKIMLKSPWWWGFGIFSLSSVIMIVSLFLGGLTLWVSLAELVYPNIDAPDNWAVGITLCVKSTLSFMIIGFIMGVIGLLKNSKKENNRITKRC
jgi:hypothetical protein